MKTITNNSGRNTSDLNLVLDEHHKALSFCSRIRKGLENDVELERIRAYTNWFQSTYLEPHFKMEEKYIFPVLGNNIRVKRGLANHRRIRKLLSCNCENDKVLNLLEEELTTHIRFEERILFGEIKNVEKLIEIEKKHNSISFDDEDWEDQFWTA